MSRKSYSNSDSSDQNNCGIIIIPAEESPFISKNENNENYENTASVSKKWSFDHIYTFIGDFGRQQKFYMSLFVMGNFITGLNQMAPVFLNIIEGTIENPSFSNETKMNCQIFEEKITENEQNFNLNHHLQPNNYLNNSIATEYNLVCNRANLIEISTTSYFIGQMGAGILAGYIGDNYGRKLPILLAALLSIFGNIIAAIIKNYGFYIFARFIVAFVMMGQLNSFIMIMELTGPSKRQRLGLSVQCFTALGNAFCSILAYFASTYQQFLFLIAACSILAVPSYFLCPESMRYLMARGKILEVSEILYDTAAKNKKEVKREEINNYLDRYPDAKAIANSTKTNDQKKKIYTVLDLFAYSPKMTIATLKNMFIWAITSLIFFGIALNANRMTGNLYYTNFIYGASEFLACGLFAPILTEKYPFRKSLGLNFLGAAFSLLMTYLVMEYTISQPINSYLATFTSFLGRFFISAAFGTLFNYTAKSFPTCLRANIISLCSASAGLGSALGPWLNVVASYLLENFNFSNSLMLMFMILAIAGFWVCQGLIEVFGVEMIMSFEDFDRVVGDGK